MSSRAEHKSLAESIDLLTCKLHEILVQRQQEFDWMRSHHGLATKQDLKELGDKIMANQTEAAAQVTKLTAQVTKIGTETRTLLDKVQELTDIIAAGGQVTPELQAAVDALQTQVDVVDALVPDAPAPTP